MSAELQPAKESLTLEKVLALAMKTPGVKINRASFLRKELSKYYPTEIVEQAIQFNPARAGVEKQCINTISKQIIQYETNKVTAISVATSLPSSLAPPLMVGAATADITSYFAFILRAVQELAYLYGFEEFDLNEDSINVDTMNTLLIFFGVMFGVQGAAVGLKKLADLMAQHVAKSLAKKALTKGAIYPVVKQIAKAIGIRMTTQIFSDSVASAIPLIGSALSGGLTYAMFKPCCNRLRKSLMNYNLCDPDYYKNYNVVDI